MAYARFGPESDVYVYGHVSGGWECCACDLPDTDYHSFYTTSVEEMREHMMEHKKVNQKVPQNVFDRLDRDASIV